MPAPAPLAALGCDVAHWQKAFDWQVAWNQGVHFGWAKVSGDRNTPLFEDPQGRRNLAEARRVGVHIGPYHFWLGGKGVNGEGQARHFYSCAGGPSRPGDVLPMIDFEDPPGGTLVLTQGDCRAMTRTTSELFGAPPIIYAGESVYQRFPWFEAETAGLARNIPNYSRRPPRRHDVHQFTPAMPMPGYPAGIDGDRAYDLRRILVQ